MPRITARLVRGRAVSASVASVGTMGALVDKAIATPPVYDGMYEATPTEIEQDFGTGGLLMVHDFKVNPIPSNYGLITWNGTTITVS